MLRSFGHRQPWWGMVFTLAVWGGLSSSAHAVKVEERSSRMVFKQATVNKREPACQLTLMHVYTSKFNKKSAQFVFTGSVMAKRSKDAPLAVSVVGQNHLLGNASKDYRIFPVARLELGIEDASVRRFALSKNVCKKDYACEEYRDSKKRELQALMADENKNINVMFPLAMKQIPLVVDLSKFNNAGKEAVPPLKQFKACVSKL